MIVNRVQTPRSEINPLYCMDVKQLMTEVDLLQLSVNAIQNLLPKVKYELRVNSTEMLDAIFEECGIELVDRVPLLMYLSK